ncbi:MAG: ribonuclease Y [Oscillospiraceae bacterium]|nr:ribonuclease Y [Oscillospiraceae bacterium]
MLAIPTPVSVLLILAALIAGVAIGAAVGSSRAKRDVAEQVEKAEARGVSKGIEQRKREAEAAIGSAEKEAERIRSAASKEAEDKKKAALVEAKDEIFKLRTEAEKEIKDRRADMSRQERRIQQKEESLDKKTEHFERREEQLQNKLHAADERLAEAEEIKKAGTEEIERIKRSELDILERISEFTKDQAKDYLLKQLDADLVHEKAVKVSAYEQQIKSACDDIARSHISMAIAKCAAEQVSEVAVSVVPLPNDEMKGRIIGREGRNIRSIESLTGVDLIIDDTPEAITLSCFDPVRREVARIALEKLIVDGRIHPASIEEKVDKARREVEKRIKQEGERAVLETNVHGLNPELVKLLGRLTFRTSYRQNVLNHSIEVATLSGILAAELGVDANMARRAGLLHDIGKALTAEIEGSHVAIGVDVCRKYKEPAEVIHAVEAHHNDVEPRTAIACIVQAADAISAARPGARSENLESYIKRLQKLEEICMSYEGVEKCYAMQAGREVRIMVKPEVIDDERMILVARQIAQQIENDMEYPGQIKVNLIRESRAVDVAK